MDAGKSIVKELVSVPGFKMVPYCSILGTDEEEQGHVQDNAFVRQQRGQHIQVRH